MDSKLGREDGHEKPRIPSTRRTSLVNRKESSTGRRSSNASSDGSCVQPSMGIPFTAITFTTKREYETKVILTRVSGIADR